MYKSYGSPYKSASWRSPGNLIKRFPSRLVSPSNLAGNSPPSPLFPLCRVLVARALLRIAIDDSSTILFWFHLWQQQTSANDWKNTSISKKKQLLSSLMYFLQNLLSFLRLRSIYTFAKLYYIFLFDDFSQTMFLIVYILNCLPS